MIITEWALQSYLDLVHGNVFSRSEYKKHIRPDVELLKSFPNPQNKFGNTNFWGPATDKSGNPIPDGYKMKWHIIGLGGRALFCRGYVKGAAAADKREAAKLQLHISIIMQGRHTERGKL